MEKFTSAAEMLRTVVPHDPVIGLRPHAAKRAATWFLENFPGKVLYAVKANNSPEIIDALYDAGIRAFDVSSFREIEQLCKYHDAELYFMNPVKPRHVIGPAYFEYGVRCFVLDCQAELEKILAETNNASDLTLFVRVACGGEGAKIALDGKFGVHGQEAVDLLMSARQAARRLGVTFHVGSQAMRPQRFSEALEDINQLIACSGVLPDMVDVGGGFPSVYPDSEPPELINFVKEIEDAFERLNVVETCELLCEPGRALVAEAGTVIARVEQRKGEMLYLNDGAYGALYDAAHCSFIYPTRLHRVQCIGQLSALHPFVLYGPTCDSADYMPGPFYMPGCIGEGDYIEFGQLGAYGHVMSTGFNGFGNYQTVILEDEPLMSLYREPDVVCQLEELAVSGVDRS